MQRIIGLELDKELEKELDKELGLEGTFFYLDESRLVNGGIIVSLSLYSSSRKEYIPIEVYIAGEFKVTKEFTTDGEEGYYIPPTS